MATYETTYDFGEDYVDVVVSYEETNYGVEVTNAFLYEDFEFEGVVYAEGTSIFEIEAFFHVDVTPEDFALVVEEELEAKNAEESLDAPY